MQTLRRDAIAFLGAVDWPFFAGAAFVFELALVAAVFALLVAVAPVAA
jgi:hypothetical protein